VGDEGTPINPKLRIYPNLTVSLLTQPLSLGLSAQPTELSLKEQSATASKERNRNNDIASLFIVHNA